MDVKRELSWTPRRYEKDGAPRYCSPACGHDCTQEDYANAHEYAQRLAQRLGPGWGVEVHENLGWHWKAKKGQATVYRHGRGRYWAQVMVGDTQYQFTAGTPKRAVAMLAKVMADHADRLKAAVLALL